MEKPAATLAASRFPTSQRPLQPAGSQLLIKPKTRSARSRPRTRVPPRVPTRGSARPSTVASTRASRMRQDSSITLGGDSTNAAVQTAAQGMPVSVTAVATQGTPVTQVAPTTVASQVGGTGGVSCYGTTVQPVRTSTSIHRSGRCSYSGRGGLSCAKLESTVCYFPGGWLHAC